MRLIDANRLVSEIESHAKAVTSQTVKAGLRLAILLVDEQPTARVDRTPAYVDAEAIAVRVVELLRNE